METKKCTKCGVEKEATLENFYKHKRGKYGLSYHCKTCRNTYMVSLYKSESAIKYSNEYRKKHKEKIKTTKREYSEKLPCAYLKSLLKAQTGLCYNDITPEIIKTKRLLILINRELNKNEKSKKQQ